MQSPKRITFITNPHLCNLRCQDCFRLQAPLLGATDEQMDFSIVEKVVRRFAPLGLQEIVPSTCGEPFLYKYFQEFLELAASENVKVNVTTNGTFPCGGVERWAPLLLPVLSDMKISVMGASAQTNEALMCGISDRAQRDNIKKMLKARNQYVAQHSASDGNKPTISLQMTVRDQNRHEVGEVQDWANRVGIDRVKTHALWMLGQENTGVQTGMCPFLGQQAWVWVDGSFQVCPNPDVRYAYGKISVLGEFGNFTDSDPLQIWQGAAYQDLCESYKKHPICQKCPMRSGQQL